LPVVRDELQMHAVGCYSANSALKRAYRLAECRLLTAERIAALAACWLDRPALQDALHALWWDLCFNQFHDTLCGTATKEGSDDAIMALGRVALGAQELANDAARAVAASADTSGPGSTVLIFNPGAEPYTGYVEYEPWTDWSPWSAGWQLVDETGAPVPHQVIETHEALSNPDDGPDRLVFPVALPPMGYRLYRFYREHAELRLEEADLESRLPWPDRQGRQPVSHIDANATDPAKASTPDRGGCYSLENDHLTVRLDPATGDIVSCVDRATGMELAGAGGWNVPLVLDDHSDTWSHGVRRFEDVIGRFDSPRITAGDPGPLQASLLVERSYEGNTWLQQLVLRAGEPELLIRNWLNWSGRWRMLKLAFDVATGRPRAFHDTPFAAIERPCDGREVPTQMWLDVSGPVQAVGSEVEAGLAVINDGKYGCDVTGSTARLTVLRCPPYTYHHPPHVIGSRQRYDWLDQGLQDFSVLLRPHIGDWRAAGIVRRARALNLPPLLVTSHAHPGACPPAGSLLHLDAPDLELTALKPAEAGRGYIVRIADRHGRGGHGRLVWAGRAFPVAITPGAVRTYLLRPWGRDRWRCVPCDMLERPLDGD
jgi:alpha-mannosidase